MKDVSVMNANHVKAIIKDHLHNRGFLSGNKKLC